MNGHEDRDPLTGLTDRERIERHELMLGALLAKLVLSGALTAEDVSVILNIPAIARKPR